MHIPDGFINAGVSAAAGVVSAGGIGYSLVKAKETLSEKLAPMAGLVAAFIFAVQMLNFPVAAGTSGHLLGGVSRRRSWSGRRRGRSWSSVVLVVQALLFADGGLTALGLNVINMALVGAFGGYAIFRVRPRGPARAPRSGVVGRRRRRRRRSSVVLASIAFTIEYAIGGNGAASVGTVVAAMVGVHVLIGIGEGIITALTVGAVLARAARPRLRRPGPAPRARAARPPPSSAGRP